jgi:hypothetical protein
MVLVGNQFVWNVGGIWRNYEEKKGCARYAKIQKSFDIDRYCRSAFFPSLTTFSYYSS